MISVLQFHAQTACSVTSDVEQVCCAVVNVSKNTLFLYVSLQHEFRPQPQFLERNEGHDKMLLSTPSTLMTVVSSSSTTAEVQQDYELEKVFSIAGHIWNNRYNKNLISCQQINL